MDIFRHSWVEVFYRPQSIYYISMSILDGSMNLIWENNKIFFKSTQKTFYKRLKMFINSRWTIKYDFTQCFYASRKNTWGVTPFTIILPHYQTITISINIIRFSNAPIKIIENRSSCFPLPNPFSSIVSCTKT